MSEEIFKVIIPLLIALLIIWLVYRIKNGIKHIIQKEVGDNFPFIKDATNNFSHKIDYLNTRVELLERRINELENKIKNI